MKNSKQTYLKKRQYFLAVLTLIVFLNSTILAQIPMHSPDNNQALLNEPLDISGDFRNFSNTYYLADSLSSFDPKTGKGEITYKRFEYSTRQAFDNMLAVLKPVNPNEFPTLEYAISPALPFSIEFISPRTVRIRASSRIQVRPEKESLMLVNGFVKPDNSAWQYSKADNGFRYKSPYGSVIITEYQHCNGSHTQSWTINRLMWIFVLGP